MDAKEAHNDSTAVRSRASNTTPQAARADVVALLAVGIVGLVLERRGSADPADKSAKPEHGGLRREGEQS